MDNYPFIKCLNPRKIVNPYTREHLIVECGCCPACSLRKSSMSAMKVKLESLSHKYNMFITLTYNNISLPKMMLYSINRFKDDCGEIEDNGHPFVLADITQRLGTQGTILGYTDNYTFVTETLSKKVELPKKILPHLSKYDAQLFIKRLRKHIFTYFTKKGEEVPEIRYYLVGEYGPLHFRPHYHVILWFENDELFKIIRQILYKSWPFGRIDCQKSQGKCSDYVAKYLTCAVSLPEVFRGKQVRPFAIHSAHLGEKVLEMPREEIYQAPFESVIKRSIPDFTTDSDFTLWRSLKTYYFPKCKGYTKKSKSERLYAYSVYVKLYRWTKETSIATQARIVVSALLIRHYHHDMKDLMYNFDDKLLDYFIESSMFDPSVYENKHQTFDDYINDVYRRIYMEIRLSKHFHKFVCKGFVNLYAPMYEKIVNFWNDNDLYNLNHSVKSIHDFVDSDWFDNTDDIDFFYINKGFDSEKYKTTKFYRIFNEQSTKRINDSVKHKKLNDANKIFNV